MLTVALFDLDDTLYARASGLWTAIRQRIHLYMVERMGFEPETAQRLRARYLEQYGTTLNGLRAEHQLDVDAYLAYVHDLPLDQYLAPSPELNAMLGRLPLRKVIFTNADAPHAQRVMARLGIAEHFERIIDIHTVQFNCKPDPRAYSLTLKLVGASAQECIFLDDAPRNLLPAHAAGITTVLISPPSAPLPPGVDYQLDSVLEFEALLAKIGMTVGQATS